MKIVVHAPYGSATPESGVMALLANYLVNAGEGAHTVRHLRCNGAFSLCDRDSERNWQRGLHSCLHCMKDQGSLAAWSGSELVDLTTYLSSDEVIWTRRFILGRETSELPATDLEGQKLMPLWIETFKNRFGSAPLDLSNKLHEQTVRRLALSTLRMKLAMRRFNNMEMPDFMFLAGGKDFITHTARQQCAAQDRAVVVFHWDMHERSVKIAHPYRDESISCALLFDGIASMRADHTSWSPDLIAILDDVLNFLDIARLPEPLPLAR